MRKTGAGLTCGPSRNASSARSDASASINGGILTVVETNTGEIVKQGRLEGAVDAYYSSPVAAGIGIGIDALIKGRKVIYEAPGTKPTRVALQPIVSGSVRGVRVTVPL